MYKLIKRLLDIVIALVALLLLSPILIPVMILLKLTGEHEIFYLQKRMGYRNQSFYIWKFATMLKNSPNLGAGIITLRNDPRVTPVGRFLRKTKINELPQLINVLKGDMSIVGPRPLLEASYKLYSPEVQARIYSNRPGLTGVGSIIFRDEEKLISEAPDPHQAYAAIYPYKGALEMWYIDNQSLTVDLVLMFLTGWVILFPESPLAEKALNNLPQRQLAV